MRISNGAPRQGKPSTMARREALRLLAIVGAAGAAGACTPARIVMGWYPREFKTDDAAVRRVLSAMARTIVPGVDASDEALVGVFYDERFPLRRVRTYLASDLCERSLSECGEYGFERLGAADRARVVASGLRADATSRKVYTGAVFLTQLALYSGFYDAAGCPEIEFEVPYRPLPPAARTYENAQDFLAVEAGSAGNYI